MTREYNTTYAEDKIREYNNNAGRVCTLWKCHGLEPDWALTYGEDARQSPEHMRMVDAHFPDVATRRHLAIFATQEQAEHAAAHYMATGQMPETSNTERSRA